MFQVVFSSRQNFILFFRLYLVPKNIPYPLQCRDICSLVMAGCGGQDGTPDHHPPLPRQHLQRGQQQLPQCQGDCRTRVS